MLLITGDKDIKYANFCFYNNQPPYKEIVSTLSEISRVRGVSWKMLKEKDEKYFSNGAMAEDYQESFWFT